MLERIGTPGIMNTSFSYSIPVLGFAAFSGTGKTTLLKQLIPSLGSRGIRIGLIKHAHHNFDIDIPGKDSYELRKAGADQVIVASRNRYALIRETPGNTEPELKQLLEVIDCQQLDLVLVEGFKHTVFPKIELHRSSMNKPFLYRDDPSIIAIACDSDLPECPIPVLDLNQPESITDYICTEYSLAIPATSTHTK